MQRALDFDKTPALGVPLPFFLNVPFFALLAGALVTFAGPLAFSSRWGAVTLALTHLWTLGILGSAMLGALLQILAVACNVPVAHARLVSSFVHATLTTGTLFLVSGFLWLWPDGWHTAALLLGLGFTVYLVAVAGALWHQRNQVYQGAREILVPIRGALLALAITVAIGVAMTVFLSLGLPVPDWIGTHVLWGLLGWGGLLVMGMSFQLLPIFQVTELYPKPLTRWLPLLVLLLLIAWTALAATGRWAPVLQGMVELLLAGSSIVWGGMTLQRLWTRKRPSPEPTTLFWYLGMISLFICVILWLPSAAQPATRTVLAVGTLFIVGVLGSIVNGMLYKIIPFLLWKHAQDAVIVLNDNPAHTRIALKTLPKMASYVSERWARAQWAAYVAVVVSWTLAALGWTAASYAAGPLLLLSAVGLTWNIARALLRYRNALHTLAAQATQPPIASPSSIP